MRKQYPAIVAAGRRAAFVYKDGTRKGEACRGSPPAPLWLRRRRGTVFG